MTQINPDLAVDLTNLQVTAPTFIELTMLARFVAERHGNDLTPGPAKRELALAITHLEDSQMRFNRAMAIGADIFEVADVEQMLRDQPTTSKEAGQ